MKTGYKWIFWSALALTVITSAAIIAVISDLSLFRSTPLLYSASLTVTGVGLGLLMRNRFYLPLLRNLRLAGKLILAPLMLLILSIPAAIIYIYYDLNGQESLKLLSALFVSLAAVFYLSAVSVISLPSMDSVHHMFIKEPDRRGKNGSLKKRTIGIIVLFAFILGIVSWRADIHGSGLVFIFPLLSLLLITMDIILTADFRNTLTNRIKTVPAASTILRGDFPDAGNIAGFRKVLALTDHYMDLVCGNFEFLKAHADDPYASVVVSVAAKSYDPALLPALDVIAGESRLTEEVRNRAITVIHNITRYYSDPGRNSDLLRIAGVSEKSATARSIMLSKRAPQISEIIKLLGDTSSEVRRIGLIAAGRYDIRELRVEVMQAFSNPETAVEAFRVLRHFGPGVYGDIIGTALKKGNSERENLMIMRLLEMMPLSAALPYLINFVGGGHLSVRLKAARSLCEGGYMPTGKQRQIIEDALDSTLNTIARLIALHLEAKRNRYFIMIAALERERAMNNEFMLSLLTLLAGRTAAEVIMSLPGSDDTFRTGIAAEAIDAVVEDPVRRPLKALLGNDNDRSRLAELALYYPVRETRGKSIASSILSSDQNITGIWTKACALHIVAAESQGLEREQAVAYLFSNSQLLQEESARAIGSLNPGWYDTAEPRLGETARNRIGGVIRGKLPGPAMIFEKTRFLSLCFNNIPEEKIMLLAQGMRYSESYDAGSIPGQMSWVIPSRDGKSGLYSLPVVDIETFVFHYSEYTDVFVHYMDKQGDLIVY
jgi:hypothetical protein